MRTMRCRLLVALAALSLACAGSESARDSGTTREAPSETGAEEGARLVVAVVNYPLSWLAREIGGDRVDVRFPVPAEEDPAFWSPGPEQIASYQRADVILLNGAGYASWTDRASLPPSKLVDTSAGFSDLYLPAGEKVVHAHGPEGEHEHGETAFTTWLDPRLASRQAEAVRDALARADASGAEAYGRGLARVQASLARLDTDLEAAFEPFAGIPLLGSHPVYQYLARRYGLDLRSVHFEPDEVPRPDGWAALQALLVDRPSRLMLWEAPPLPEVSARLAREFGVRSVVFDPCGNRPEEGDFLSVMEANVARVTAAVEGG
jgi:zinc transport system substrate-binding protein